MLKTGYYTFATISGISGFVSAYYWLVASKIEIEPVIEQSPIVVLELQVLHQAVETGANAVAFRKSGELNKKAAFWAAIAVAASSVATLVVPEITRNPNKEAVYKRIENV
ncbi:MAG: hypothetical protein ACHP7O_02925 [Burkholderiales bacterium]